MSRLSRRRLLTLAGAGGLGGGLAGLGALTGCSSVLPAPDTAAAGFGEDATGVVRVWCRAATQAGLVELVSAFNTSQDRLTVELTPVLDAQYVTKLATAIRGGEVPDLVDIDDINSMLFIYRDAFTDLTELVAGLDYAAELSPGHLRLATRDERIYGVPYLADNSLLWFDLDLCEAAGVDPDEAVTDLDHVLDAARAVGELGRPDTWAWSFPGNATGTMGFVVQPMVWAADADMITGEVGAQRGDVEGNPAVRGMLEFYRALWAEELAVPTSFADDASRWGADFRGGGIAMFPGNIEVTANQVEPARAERMTSRLLPGYQGGGAFFDGGDNMCIPRGAANASGAWEFARFAMDLPQQFALPSYGFTPIRADVADEEFRETYPQASVPLDDLDAGYAPTTLAYNLIYNQPDGPWLTMLRRAIFDGDVDGAMAEGQAGWDAILDQAQA